jgi:fatty-acyl-CoA synthase
MFDHHQPQSWVGDWSRKRRALTPDREALVDATTGERYTYADLDRRANRTARLLEDHGVTDGARVAVVSRNRPAVVDLFFATGKTGGVLAPLSHRLAERELGTLLTDVNPKLLVVEEPFEDRCRGALGHENCDVDPAVLSLPTEGAHGWQSYDEALPDADAPVATRDMPPDDPHLFLHTGGSTGTPKETVITHEGVVWNSLNTITAWGLREDDVTPMVFPMFHTGGWNVLTLPLFHMGGTVIIAREVDPGQVLSLVDCEAATVLVAVPAVLRMMTEQDDWEQTDLSTLRFVKSGGGPCREAVMEVWWDRGVDLSQGYGLTECGPNNFAMPEGWPREKADTVGKPVTHVDARIVDDDGDERPTGDIGELELRSPHAADRYWQNETESAATFGDGWVSTGDLAAVDDDGYVSIEGRKKNMYVSGGENVYPAAVEDVLSKHPKVDEVVVIPVPDDRWGQVGKAVVQGEETLTLAELEAVCEGKLAGYERPRHLVSVDEMPKSGPSKIDRDAVADRYAEQ